MGQSCLIETNVASETPTIGSKFDRVVLPRRLPIAKRRCRVAIVGSGQLADCIEEYVNAVSPGYKLIAKIDKSSVAGFQCSDLKQLVERKDVDVVVVALPERRGVFPAEELLFCRRNGIRVEDGVEFYEKLCGRISLTGLTPSSLIFGEGFHRLKRTLLAKRVIDVLLSMVGMVLAIPAWLLLPIVIKMESQGPILFRQQRLGKDETTFQLLKFRTMDWNRSESGDPRWSTKHDPRLTRVGRIIRRWRLDELPQLWNVFKGDLSFVGPRPDVVSLRDTLKGGVPYYSLRTAVKPGITGWAQVRYHYVSSIAEGIERHEYDLYYIKNMTLLLDLRIVVKTIGIVMLGRGAR